MTSESPHVFSVSMHAFSRARQWMRQWRVVTCCAKCVAEGLLSQNIAMMLIDVSSTQTNK